MFVVSFECRKSIEVQSWNTDFTHILRMRELKKKVALWMPIIILPLKKPSLVISLQCVFLIMNSTQISQGNEPSLSFSKAKVFSPWLWLYCWNYTQQPEEGVLFFSIVLFTYAEIQLVSVSPLFELVYKPLCNVLVWLSSNGFYTDAISFGVMLQLSYLFAFWC